MLYTHIPDISCFYSDSAGDALAEPTAHFEYEMLLITGGKASAAINHISYCLEAGDLIFISRLERHNYLVEDEPYCRYVVSLSGSLILSYIKDTELASIFIQRPKGFTHVVHLSENAYHVMLPLFHQMAEEYAAQEAFYSAKSAALFLSVLIELYRTNPEYFPMRAHTELSDAVLNAQRRINDHFMEKLTLQEIANANFVTRHSLTLAFKDIVGINFKEYLILFRITEAKKLLITTDLSVSQIAEAVGYGNVNNFLRIFKKREQTTPLQYRKHYTYSAPLKS